MKITFKLGLSVLMISAVYANDNHQKSKYVGQENRKIKSLSMDDINELKKGAGWGLAKAAELNGYPGPSHILQMKDKIDLTLQQQTKIETIYKIMKAEAIVLGTKLIHLEKQLNDKFANKTISQNDLEQIVTKIENIRTKLRVVHLSTHLKTPEILSSTQIDLYNNLRGYSKNPCLNIPEGHDVKMWKKHNGCK